ncbi:hypothetical protein [Streptomyces yanii]|uniref:Uncharacterized protein n=1 Tax=Streptomyces yanii TaxID=78510 RepID=A0ABV5R4A6_9ACTN
MAATRQMSAASMARSWPKRKDERRRRIDTRWASDWSDDEWFRVGDLGEVGVHSI